VENRKNIFVIIPCFNEGAIIRRTVNGVLSCGYTVVVVDDASWDNTREELKGVPAYYIRHQVNLGQGAALQTGIDFAKKRGADCFVTFDADGQHLAEDIEKMIKVLRDKKADIIFGSRFLPNAETNVSVSRAFVLNMARYLNRLVSGFLLSDAYNGLRVFNRKAAEKIVLTENRMAHATQFQVLTAKHKLKYAECPISILYTDYSRRKGLKNQDGIKIFFEIILYKIYS